MCAFRNSNASCRYEEGLRAPKAFIPPNAALRYEVQVLRCLPAGENGEERLCCSDANFPCDPEGLVSAAATTTTTTTTGEGDE